MSKSFYKKIMSHIEKKLLRINNRRLNKQYAFGGSGILDSILQFIVKTFTSQGAKVLASSAAKEVGKAAIDLSLIHI